MPLLLVACFALSVHGQSAAAPASNASVPTLYQRPNNSDCVASASSSTNYFPLQFQIVGSSPAEEDRVNVREQRICSASCQAPRALTDAYFDCAQVTVAQDFTVQYMDSYKVAIGGPAPQYSLADLKTAAHIGAGSDKLVRQRDVYFVPMWNKSAIS